MVGRALPNHTVNKLITSAPDTHCATRNRASCPRLSVISKPAEKMTTSVKVVTSPNAVRSSIAARMPLLSPNMARTHCRSEKRRVGKECVSTCRTRGCTVHEKKQKTEMRLEEMYKKHI